MEKRTILAILFSIVIWVVWFGFFSPDQKTQKPKPDSEKSAGEQRKTPDLPLSDVHTQVKIQAEAAAANEIVAEIETEKYRIELTNIGAGIRKVKYKERDFDLVVDKTIFNTKGNFDFTLHFNENELVNSNALDTLAWSCVKYDRTVRFNTAIVIDGNPAVIEKKYTFTEKGYDFRVEYRIQNISGREVTYGNGQVIISPSEMLGPDLDFTNQYNKLSSIYYLNGDFKQDNKGGGFFSKPETLKKETGTVQWAGIMSRYFLIVMIPEGFTASGIVHDNREGTGFRTGMYVPLGKLKPGEEVRKSFRVYLGEKDKKYLASVDKILIDAADISKWIEPIRYFVLWALMNINRLFGNLGWSLFIFSLITKIVFMPLTIKSTESMKNLQKLTPQMNEIKEKYKDKPDVLQREMMKLYKENKVNPFGGCLPLLLQMPFFFALYSALINSIDLWHAPFILWIKDLSMPDTVATVAGFNINILPLLMTATTFVQQKISSVDTGNQQQKIMLMVMPLVLIFVFWSMPSGLVLYWSLQNIFQIGHQVFVNKRAKSKES